jgi:hypothetical protein
VTKPGLSELVLEPGLLSSARVVASVEANPPGAVDVRISGEHPFGLLPSAPSSIAPKLRVQGKVSSFPTALVDALAKQDGLIVDVLGPQLDAEIAGAWPSTDKESLQAKMHSQKAKVDLVAQAREMVLVGSGDQGLDASFGITPLFSKRVIGSLVPLLVDVQQASEQDRAALTLRSFQLPLNGDLRQLSGRVTLDLGAISYRFLPGIADAFSSSGKAAEETHIDPVIVQIEKGVARYDSLLLPIGGRKVAFKGSVDLVEKSYKLDAKVPLSLLGKSALKQIEQALSFVDANTEVPIRVRGSAGKPKISIDDDFVKEILKQSAGNALEDLLGGKKKKKND